MRCEPWAYGACRLTRGYPLGAVQPTFIEAAASA